MITREEEKKTAKKHLAARHGVGSEEDGVHLAGNCHHGKSTKTGGNNSPVLVLFLLPAFWSFRLSPLSDTPVCTSRWKTSVYLRSEVLQTRKWSPCYSLNVELWINLPPSICVLLDSILGSKQTITAVSEINFDPGLMTLPVVFVGYSTFTMYYVPIKKIKLCCWNLYLKSIFFQCRW